MHKRKACYNDIIDLDKELKIYHKLCRGKCKEYAYYSDWKEHIENQFSQISSERRKEDFKALLRLRQRNASNLKGFASSMVIFVATLLLNKAIPDHLCKNDTADEYSIFISLIIYSIFTFAWIYLLVWIFSYIGKETLSEGRVKAFYTDLLEILDKMEKKEKE